MLLASNCCSCSTPAAGNIAAAAALQQQGKGNTTGVALLLTKARAQMYIACAAGVYVEADPLRSQSDQTGPATATHTHTLRLPNRASLLPPMINHASLLSPMITSTPLPACLEAQGHKRPPLRTIRCCERLPEQRAVNMLQQHRVANALKRLSAPVPPIQNHAV